MATSGSTKALKESFKEEFNLAYERKAFLFNSENEFICTWINELNNEIERQRKEIIKLKGQL